MEETRDVLVDEIVNAVMSQAGELADSCGCGGCLVPPGGD